jgi:hypothetical protein
MRPDADLCAVVDTLIPSAPSGETTAGKNTGLAARYHINPKVNCDRHHAPSDSISRELGIP